MENRAYIKCNTNVFWIRGVKKCGVGAFTTREMNHFLELDCHLDVLGKKTNDYLTHQIIIEYSKETIDRLIEEAKENTNEQFYSLQRQYGYKTKNDMYKNMMFCDLRLSNNKLTISPWKRKGPEAWNGMDEEHKIIIRFPIPDELLGAAIRFAFTRCVGSGAIKVAKLLFPTGIPESLDEYLASVNPNYKNWLISAGE